MDKTYVINPGPITSFNSLAYNLGPQLDDVRNLYSHGSSPKIVLDLRHLSPGNINISALASLLSICHKLSRFLGNPIETVITLNPYVQRLLNHVDFFHIARKLDILYWDERTVGGFWKSDMHPYTKLLYFGDVVPSIAGLSSTEITRIKGLHKQRIGPNFSLRCAEIFKGFDDHLEYTVENTALELIANSLIHGKDVAFVGIERNSKRISVSVCDSGIGFKRSLSHSYPQSHTFKEASNIQALIIGSVIQEHEHGLRRAINHVLNYDEYTRDYYNDGWVIISSFNSEIRWQKPNWEKALNFYKENEVHTVLPNIDLILGSKTTRKLSYEEVELGYWKQFRQSMVGTRITFEIPLI